MELCQGHATMHASPPSQSPPLPAPDLHLIRAACPRIMSTEIRAKGFPFYFWSNRPRHVGRSQGQHLLRSRGKWHASWWLSPVLWGPGSSRQGSGVGERSVLEGNAWDPWTASLLRVKPVRSPSGLCAQGSETQAQGRKTGWKANRLPSAVCSLKSAASQPVPCPMVAQLWDRVTAVSPAQLGLMVSWDREMNSVAFYHPFCARLGLQLTQVIQEAGRPLSLSAILAATNTVVFPGGTTPRTEAGCWQGAGPESSLRKKFPLETRETGALLSDT